MDRKRLFYIAGAVILILIISTSLLLKTGKKDASKAADPNNPEAEQAMLYDPWEYTTVMAECEYDNGTATFVCAIGDRHQLMPNLLEEKGREGWELADIYNRSYGDRLMTLFAFKRQPVSK